MAKGTSSVLLCRKGMLHWNTDKIMHEYKLWCKISGFHRTHIVLWAHADTLYLLPWKKLYVRVFSSIPLFFWSSAICVQFLQIWRRSMLDRAGACSPSQLGTPPNSTHWVLIQSHHEHPISRPESQINSNNVRINKNNVISGIFCIELCGQSKSTVKHSNSPNITMIKQIFVGRHLIAMHPHCSIA